MKHFKWGEVIEPTPAPTQKEGTPIRVMLRVLTIFNHGESRKKGIRLPEMAKIGIPDPSIRCKEFLIECT